MSTMHRAGQERASRDVDGPLARDARATLDELYRDYGPRVVAICGAILRDRLEAEDAAQQVFVSALRALVGGTVPVNAGAWLAAIARNECLARGRRPTDVPLSRELPDQTRDDAISVVTRQVEVAALWEMIDELPAAQREALLLREVRGLAYDELADTLQVSRPSVRSLLRRARQTLRARLEQGAAALGGLPSLSTLARVLGDGSNPVLSNATKTAAVGLGAVAITSGAIVAPTRSHHPRPHAGAAPSEGGVRSNERAPQAGAALPAVMGRRVEIVVAPAEHRVRSAGATRRNVHSGRHAGARARPGPGSRGQDESGSSAGSAGSTPDGSGSHDTGGTPERSLSDADAHGDAGRNRGSGSRGEATSPDVAPDDGSGDHGSGHGGSGGTEGLEGSSDAGVGATETSSGGSGSSGSSSDLLAGSGSGETSGSDSTESGGSRDFGASGGLSGSGGAAEANGSVEGS